jgi:hypothetical protein
MMALNGYCSSKWLLVEFEQFPTSRSTWGQVSVRIALYFRLGCREGKSDYWIRFRFTGGLFLKSNLIHLTLGVLVASSTLIAQTIPPPQDQQAGTNPPVTSKAKASHKGKKDVPPPKPFSRLAFGGGIGLMGINLQAATNLNKYMNVRGTGNFFNYTTSNINVSNFGVQGKFNLATAGASVDFYPFYRHGFRLSPGVLFYNNNEVSATGVGASGTSITLNGQKFYSETADPLTLDASLGLNTRKQAFTMTTGWGNMIPRRGGHWSVPLELGAAFTGVPTINVALSGFACTNAADASLGGPSCVNMATNTQAQSDLTAQVSKWKSDLNPYQIYPIISIGVTYAFGIR